MKLKQAAPSIVLALIFVFAAYLRLAAIELAEFEEDEAGALTAARSMVKNGVVPLLGPPLTTGGHSGPVYYYILGIPLTLSENPVAASVFVVLLNLIGLLLTYRFAKKFFNQRVALITSALYAVSPFAVLFSRKIWNPDLVFPFVTATMYCMYAFAVEKKPRYLVGVLVSYAVVLQVHPITIFLAPVLLLFMVILHRQVVLKHLGLGVLAAAVVFSPFIYGIVESRTGEASSFLATASYFDFSSINPTVIQSLASITSGSGFDYILGSSAGAFYASVHGVNDYFVVESVLLFAGMFFVLWKAMSGAPAERLKHAMLFAWICIPVGLLLLFDPKFGLLPHEVVMFLPANFLVIAILFDRGLAAAKRGPLDGRVVRLMTVAVLLSIVLVQAFFFVGFNTFLLRHGGTAGDYGVGVGYKIDAVKYIIQDSNGTSFTVSSDFSAGNIASEYVYLLTMYGKTASNSASTLFVVIDNLAPPSGSLLARLASYPNRSFGPLTVYVDTSY